MTELKRVLIMAGGTGGHVFPGLAVARYLANQGVEVHWMGTSQGLEARVIPEANIPLHLVTISGLRGKGIKPLLTAPIKITTAIMQSKRIIHAVNPDVVIGMGGFVSGPGGIASWIMRRPLLIHEQNAKAGYTNKRLARFATRVLTGFPNAFPSSPKVMTVGNPVRSELESLQPPTTRLTPPRHPLRLLVLGGSLGAQALNDIVPQALTLLSPDERPEVWHQAGEKHFEAAKNGYQSKGIQAKVVPFIKEMDQAYGWADVVLCRAGALTVAECCAVGLGAVFVPFPHAVDDHQTANADFLVQHQAALCIQQSVLTASQLADIVRQFSREPETRMKMAQAAYALRQVNVPEKIYHICKEICR